MKIVVIDCCPASFFEDMGGIKSGNYSTAHYTNYVFTVQSFASFLSGQLVDFKSNVIPEPITSKIGKGWTLFSGWRAFQDKYCIDRIFHGFDHVWISDILGAPKIPCQQITEAALKEKGNQLIHFYDLHPPFLSSVPAYGEVQEIFSTIMTCIEKLEPDVVTADHGVVRKDWKGRELIDDVIRVPLWTKDKKLPKKSHHLDLMDLTKGHIREAVTTKCHKGGEWRET